MKQLSIIYQDEDIVVVEKPGGLLSVPGRGPENFDSISARLRNRFSSMIDQPAVHRLDMYTSGLMVYAITKEAHRHLSIQFAGRTTKKIYQAVVEGSVEDTSGEIRLAFRLDPDNRPYQVYDPELGKLGISLWKKLSQNETRTAVEFHPVTGRTHQLRLHAAHPLGLNAPIVGDSLYGSGQDGDQMLLHATELRFNHPVTEERMRFTSQAPFRTELSP